MWWPHGDAREKGRVITVRRERPGSSPQLVPCCSSPLIQEIHGDLRSLVCAGPARLLLTACVLPSLAAGCGFGSERPDCCHLNESCLCLPKPESLQPCHRGLWCGVSELLGQLGCSWNCSPVSSSLLNTGTSETCRTQAGFIQAELAAVPSSWQGGKLQQDKRGGPNPAMAD